MRSLLILLCMVGILFSGCITVNQDPEILLSEPYRRVEYIAAPGADHTLAEVIQVTTRGELANILNSIPRLYLKALEWSGQQPVILTNFRITTFTKLEEFEIPYQECRSLSGMISVPQTSCVGGSCSTLSAQRSLFNRYCWTEYRTEVREVTYQKAMADIVTKKTKE